MFCFFFFNDTATTEIYTLSLHDALPISTQDTGRSTQPSALSAPSRSYSRRTSRRRRPARRRRPMRRGRWGVDRKSTRLNSSHLVISYAVFCLKKKKTHTLVYVVLNVLVA